MSSQIIGRTAYRTYGVDRDLLLRAELADRLARVGVSLHGHDRPQRDDDAER